MSAPSGVGMTSIASYEMAVGLENLELQNKSIAENFKNATTIVIKLKTIEEVGNNIRD